MFIDQILRVSPFCDFLIVGIGMKYSNRYSEAKAVIEEQCFGAEGSFFFGITYRTALNLFTVSWAYAMNPAFTDAPLKLKIGPKLFAYCGGLEVYI